MHSIFDAHTQCWLDMLITWINPNLMNCMEDERLQELVGLGSHSKMETDNVRVC